MKELRERTERYEQFLKAMIETRPKDAQLPLTRLGGCLDNIRRLSFGKANIA